MQTLLPGHRRPAAALRAIVVTLATLAVATACSPDDPLPTGPRVTPPAAPRATVVGASVTVLEMTAYDINDAGQVVGVKGPSPGHAALWTSGGGTQDLGTIGGTYSIAFAVNESGQVVGVGAPAGDGVDHAFLWTAAAGMRDLGTLGGPSSWATGINDAGEVVGWSDTPGDVARHAFLWTPTRGMQDLGTLGGAQSRAASINNAGQVVGGSQTVTGHEHAFLWTSSGGMQDLGHLGGSFSRAVAINEAGQVVGMSSGPDGVIKPFLWTPGQGMRDLGALPGDYTEARDISDAGQVVGLNDSHQAAHAFLWTSADGYVDLFPITQMSSVSAINNQGQVVGGNRLATLQFDVPNRAPVASVGGPYIGHKKKPVVFDGTGSSDPDGDGVLYAWDFGDGSPLASGATPVHAYDAWGTYTVTLTVSDPSGLSATQSTTAVIAPPGYLKNGP